MISLAILGVGLVGALRVFPVGLRASQRSEASSRAAILLQRTVELLKLRPWEELVEGESSAQEDAFEVTTRIGQPTLPGLVDPTRLKAVEVTVRWTQQGRPRELGVLTYLRHETR